MTLRLRLVSIGMVVTYNKLIHMYKGNTAACGLGTEILIGTPGSLKSFILKSHLHSLSVKGNIIPFMLIEHLI